MAATVSATDVELLKPVNVIMQNTLLRNAKALAPYFAGTSAAEIAEHGGTFTAKWRRIENLTPTTTALTELTGNASAYPRDSVAASVTDVTATVAKFGQYIILSEEADLANFSSQMNKLIEILGISAGRSLNMVQRNEMEDNATIVYGTAAAASDGAVVTAATKDNFKGVINTLLRNDAMPFSASTVGSQNIGTSPILAAFWAINHPDVSVDVEGFAGFKSVETYAGQVEVMPGEYGLIQSGGHAVRFIQTSDASIDANSGGATGSTGLRGATNIDLYSVPVYGKDAVGSLGLGTKHVKEVYRAGDNLPAVQLINKGFGSAGAADPFNELSTLAWKAWSAAKVLNSTWIRTVRVGATDI